MQHSTKSQIQITETIMVLAVFFILLAVILVVYFQYQFSNIREFGQDIERQRNSLLLYSITSMPEIKCSLRAYDRECIDSTKLMAFKEAIAPEDYRNLFYDINITIKQIYPESPESECTPSLYQARNCNTITIYSKAKYSRKISTPISLYYPLEDEYKIASLIITY